MNKKKVRLISGYMENQNNTAIVLVDGIWYSTSRILDKTIVGRIIYIETKNSIYTNCREMV